ncbi:hypothetical protein [Rubritalea tangerina]
MTFLPEEEVWGRKCEKSQKRSCASGWDVVLCARAQRNHSASRSSNG